MMPIFLAGAATAVFFIVLSVLIRQSINLRLESLRHAITSETLARLQETGLKLDSMRNSLERLERGQTNMTTLLRDLRSTYSEPKTPVGQGGSKGSAPSSS